MLTRIRTDLTASMKARDELRSSTLRMVLAAVQTAEVAGKQARTLADEEVVSLVATEAKKRRESAAAFDAGDRPELAAKERAEAQILAEYLPEQLDADAISALVTHAVADAGAAGEGMRAIMGAGTNPVRVMVTDSTFSFNGLSGIAGDGFGDDFGGLDDDFGDFGATEPTPDAEAPDDDAVTYDYERLAGE